MLLQIPTEFHGEVKHFARIAAVLEGSDPANPTRAGGRVLTGAEIAAAVKPGCMCEEPPINLRPGLNREQLNRLGAGCCDTRVNPGRGWVCPTLDKLRRAWDR